MRKLWGSWQIAGPLLGCGRAHVAVDPIGRRVRHEEVSLYSLHLLGGVAVVAEALAQLPVEPGLGACPMHLMPISA